LFALGKIASNNYLGTVKITATMFAMAGGLLDMLHFSVSNVLRVKKFLFFSTFLPLSASGIFLRCL